MSVSSSAKQANLAHLASERPRQLASLLACMTFLSLGSDLPALQHCKCFNFGTPLKPTLKNTVLTWNAKASDLYSFGTFKVFGGTSQSNHTMRMLSYGRIWQKLSEIRFASHLRWCNLFMHRSEADIFINVMAIAADKFRLVLELA